MKITNKILFALLLLAFAAHSQSQQIRVAVMATVDDADSIQYMELNFLTGKLREIAGNTLPERQYGIMTQESIVDRLGSQERAEKECREASCLAELGRKISADYIAQGRIGRFGGMLALKVELYNSKSGNLVSTFNEASKDLFTLVRLLDDKAPDLFRKILRENKAQPSVASGIRDLEKAVDYELGYGKYYIANIATEPQGAVLSFDGEPNERCPKTPCKVELAEGRVRILASLEQYERADTTISITRNEQDVVIKLKPNFGILEIKPVYSGGIGRDRQWNLLVNDKYYSLGEIRLSPGSYDIKLNHECYENIGFKVGINKSSREVFDMDKHIVLKKGGLVLSAKKDGKPVSEPVFVNGKPVGETPFSGTVPLCSEIEIGSGKEKVDVKLKYKDKVKHIHTMRTSPKYIYEEDKAWKYSISLGLGVPMMMNSINTIYKSEGFLLYADIEFSRSNISIGANLDLGFLGIESGAVRGGRAINDPDFTLFLKPNFFAKLYPVDFWYLSGGLGFGFYGGYTDYDGQTRMYTNAPVFSIGTGLVFFPSSEINPFLEAQYNMLPFNRDARYLSINIGLKTMRVYADWEKRAEENMKRYKENRY